MQLNYIDIMKRALDILETGGVCPECNGEPDLVYGADINKCACEGYGHVTRLDVYTALRGRWLSGAWDQTASGLDISFNGDDIPF